MDSAGNDDIVYVGATRPTMKLGVVWPAFVLNMIVSMSAFILAQNMLWGLIFVPIHGVLVLVCRYEPRIFDLLANWLRNTSPLLRTRAYWGACTVSPLDIAPSHRRGPFARAWRRASALQRANAWRQLTSEKGSP